MALNTASFVIFEKHSYQNVMVYQYFHEIFNLHIYIYHIINIYWFFELFYPRIDILPIYKLIKSCKTRLLFQNCMFLMLFSLFEWWNEMYIEWRVFFAFFKGIYVFQTKVCHHIMITFYIICNIHQPAIPKSKISVLSFLSFQQTKTKK